jgi:hypothetical protein
MRADRSFATVLVILLGALLAGRPAAASPADGGSSVPRPRRLAIAQPPPEPYVLPGADLVPVPAPAPRRPLARQWWFWAAVGGVVATTVAVIVIASRPPSAPASTLGNMEAFRGR